MVDVYDAKKKKKACIHTKQAKAFLTPFLRHVMSVFMKHIQHTKIHFQNYPDPNSKCKIVNSA